MVCDINEHGDTLCTCPNAYSATEKINKLISAWIAEPVMQETYLYLNHDLNPETFFLRRSLWEKILAAAKTDVYVRGNSVI
jgi:hypothetical protein